MELFRHRHYFLTTGLIDNRGMSGRFQTFVTRLRPHRIAVLTDADDNDWQGACKAIIEYLTQIWGGYHSLIIPTDGRAIDDVFWTQLSFFDPDVIIRYQKTHEDLKRSDAAAFERIFADHLEQTKAYEYISDGTDATLRRNFERSPLGRFSISDHLSKLLLNRLSPFHYEGELRIPAFACGDSPSHPLTSVEDVLGAVEAPNVMYDMNNNLPVDREAPPLLWLAAESGLASPAYQARLQEKGVTPVFKYMNTESDSDIIRWGIQPSYSLGASSPFSFSELALGTVRTTASPRFRIPSIIVVGDTIRDFCLYYALSRLHSRAIWLPAWFFQVGEGYPRRLMTAVMNLQERAEREHCEQMAVVSLSMPFPQLHEIVATLRKYTSQSSFVVENGAATDFIETLVEHPCRLYVKKNIERFSTHQLVDDTLPGSLESPLPSSFLHVNPYNHRWLVEVTFMGNMTPRHPALGAKLAYAPNLDTVRAGRDGVTYECPGPVVTSSDMELQILRPTITIPGPEKIFRIVLADCGYECAVSDKGRYESETIKKFGGIEQVGWALRHNKLSVLLREFLNADGPKKGVYDAGVYLDKRRYLNFDCMIKLLGDQSLARATVDDYIARQILYRGFVLKCIRCSAIGWFSVAEITENFTCRRCGINQQYTQASWKTPNEPAWFYKLDEMVYQMLQHRGDTTLLTLNALRAKAKTSFHFAPELAIRPLGTAKSSIEVDIPCIKDGEMYIGEAKSVDTLAAENFTAGEVAARYRDLAEKMNASGVIFSTSAAGWNETTKEAIGRAFESHRHLKVLTMSCENL
jgi:hypothetical protein